MTKWDRIWVIKAFSVSLLFVGPALGSELVDLARDGDVAGVTSALDAGAEVDEQGGGVTALYVASEAGNVELARLLIDRGADVDLLVKFQRTPLYGAITTDHPDVVRLLLDSGADPNKITKLQNPLHIAAQEGCLQCVIDLVGAGGDVNALTSIGSPPVHLAKRGGYEDIVAFLLDHGGAPPVTAPISPLLASADTQLGKQTFEKNCVECHIATSEPETSKRPNLWGIVGRARAQEGDVDYSPVMREVGGTWTFENLNSFIAYPTRTLPGTTMEYVGVKGEKERAEIIAYLRTLSDAPVPLP